MGQRAAPAGAAPRPDLALGRFGDALLGTAVGLALALIIVTGEGGTREPDLLAYLFAAGFGALLLLRRGRPRTVLVLSALGMFAYYTFDYPPIGVAIPVVAALFSAAEAGLTTWSVAVAAVVFAVSTYYRVRDGVEAIGFLIGYESVSNGALFAAAIALGYGVRARRVRASQQAEIVRLTEAQLARAAKVQLQAERERISRDLHDTVGHALSVISLQAGVGIEPVGREDVGVLHRHRPARSSRAAIACTSEDQASEIQAFWVPDPRRMRADSDPDGQALLDRLRPATARHPQLRIVIPDPELDDKGRALVWEAINDADVEEVDESGGPDADDLDPEPGENDDSAPSEDDDDQVPVGRSTTIVPFPRRQAVEAADDYGPPEETAAEAIEDGDLVLVDDRWVVVESAERDLLDDQTVVVAWRSVEEDTNDDGTRRSDAGTCCPAGDPSMPTSG